MSTADWSRARVALVTGAGRGLGAAIASSLAEQGYSVAVNDLAGNPQASRLVDAIRASGGRAEFCPADVTDEASVSALIADIAQRLGPVHVLVVNATGPQPAIELPELSWADLTDQLRFFAKSPLLLVQAVTPMMRAGGGGRVIMIGSDLADRVEPGLSAYSAAKAAQRALARTWARELAADRITVNLVAPGWIPVERHAGTPAAVLAGYLDRVPLGQFGTPADIAAAVSFLASDAAGFITGEQLTVNGGHGLS